MVNVTKMLDLIRQNPGIRTVQLSDKLDCDIDRLNDVLQHYVDRGEIVRQEVIAPNQRKAMAYWIAGAETAPAVSAPPPVQGKPKTNVEKAVEFIAANGGKVTSAQLHAVLGLAADEYPSQYLGGGIKDGRLVKDGKFWLLGTAAGTASEKVSAASPAAEKQEVTPVAAEPVKVPQFLKKAATPSAPAPQQPAEVEKPAAAPEYLKIRMIEEPTFTIQLGPVTLSGMRQVSEWNGIKELRDSQGRALIVLAEEMPFARMFGAIAGTTEQDITVIKGHPELIHQLAAVINAERKAA